MEIKDRSTNYKNNSNPISSSNEEIERSNSHNNVKLKGIQGNRNDKKFYNKENLPKESTINLKPIDHIFKQELNDKQSHNSSFENEKIKYKKQPDLLRSKNVIGSKRGSIIHITQNTQNNYSIINNTNVINNILQNNAQFKIKSSGILKDIHTTELKKESPKKKVNFVPNDTLVKKFYLDTPEPQTNSERRDNRMLSTKDKKNNTQVLLDIIKKNQETRRKSDWEGNKINDEKSINGDKFDSKMDISHLKKEEYKLLLNNPDFYQSINGKTGIISGFCSNTIENFMGINEDQMNIGVNLKLSSGENQTGKNINFFSIFDGHGGSAVSEELKNSFRQHLLSDPEFFYNTEDALTRTFQYMENKIINRSLISNANQSTFDKSGSCALIILVIDDVCYCANLGNSKAIISLNVGRKINSLSIDHKPSTESEKKRVLAAGGFVYQSEKLDNNNFSNNSNGILRTRPGGLGVTRTIGDIETKLEKFNGIPGVIIAEPDIITFKLNYNIDFIILGSDGLLEKISNKDITIIVLETVKSCIKQNLTFLQLLVKITNRLITEAIDRESKDSITCIFICFNNLYELFVEQNLQKIDYSIKNLRLSNFEFEELYDDTLSKNLYNIIDKSNKNNFNKDQSSVFGHSLCAKTNKPSFISINEKKKEKISKKDNNPSSACSCTCVIY